MLESETANERPWSRQRLRVPREAGALFAEPSLQEAADLARQNRSCLQCSSANIQGRTLDSLRHWSREQVAGAARSYTSKLLDESIPEQPFDYLLAAGHQPTLFHAGVWVKNFAIGELASQTGGLAVNLVVDNDTLTAAHIRVPDGNRNRPRVQTVAFDREHASEPWEESQILDRGLFESFSQRLNDQMASWNIEPLINTAWPYAVRHMERSTSLRDCLTTARVQLERKWGLSNLELPISQLCELDSFLWFAAHVFAQLPRFREIHNQVLHEYRVINRIRSRTHPVPELKFESGWHEAPFWIWRSGDAHRSRVYARQQGESVQLSDGNDVFATLPLTVDADATDAVDVLRRLPEQGFRLRTRALTTTLFAAMRVRPVRSRHRRREVRRDQRSHHFPILQSARSRFLDDVGHIAPAVGRSVRRSPQ